MKVYCSCPFGTSKFYCSAGAGESARRERLDSSRFVGKICTRTSEHQCQVSITHGLCCHRQPFIEMTTIHGQPPWTRSSMHPEEAISLRYSQPAYTWCPAEHRHILFFLSYKAHTQQWYQSPNQYSSWSRSVKITPSPPRVQYVSSRWQPRQALSVASVQTSIWFP